MLVIVSDVIWQVVIVCDFVIWLFVMVLGIMGIGLWGNVFVGGGCMGLFGQ